MARAVDAYCEKCGKVRPDTRPAPDVVKPSGAFMMLCSDCWFATKPTTHGKRDDK